jgi:hypothetical protein
MSAPAAAASTSKSPPLWEDFVDILYAPTSVFERRRDARFGMALLVLLVLFAVIFFATRPLLQPLYDRGIDAAIAKIQARPNMSADQREAAAAMTRRFAGFLTPIKVLVATPLLVFFGAALTWLVGKIVGSRAQFGQMMMVATYANVPRVIGAAVGAALLLVLDPQNLPVLSDMTVSPALLLGPDASPLLVAFASRLDLFTLWTTVLYGLGLAVVGKVSRRSAFVAVAIGWAVATGFALLGVLRQMAAG